MTKYGYQDRDGDGLVIEPSNIDGFTRFTTFTGRDEQTVIVPNEEIASLLLGTARVAGWQPHSEQVNTQPRCTPGSVEDWQADVLSGLAGAIRKAADDKVKAEAEAEELEHAAHLLAAASPAFTLSDARHELRKHENIRRTWLTVVRAARAQFAPNTLPF